ncbi:MAG TPA: hypothetical protein VFE53_04300 [Mucilaginibacter sp.]|jgi:hypothetical protein|nr:hypothetical protein [Mucilaginibacter sp.]
MAVESGINVLSTISGFLPVLAALVNYKNLDKILKIAAVYCLVSVISDIALQMVVRVDLPNNYPVIHIYIAISILLLGAMYFYAFFNPMLKNTVLVTSSVVLAFAIADMIFMEGINDYPSLSNTVLSILITCFSLLYFYQLLTRQEFVHIEKQALFWINAGMLFYFAINIFVFMLFKRILSEHKVSLYVINNLSNIVANILFTVGLLCKPQNQKATSYQY